MLALLVGVALVRKTTYQYCNTTGCGQHCSAHECALRCSGPDCGQHCSAEQCAQYCSGPDCGQHCQDWNCAVFCSGPNCGQNCLGNSCAAYCTGTNCGHGNKRIDLTCSNYYLDWHCDSIELYNDCTWNSNASRCCDANNLVCLADGPFTPTKPPTKSPTKSPTATPTTSTPTGTPTATPTSSAPNGTESGDHTVLIIVLSVVGGLIILGGAVYFLYKKCNTVEVKDRESHIRSLIF